MLTKVKTQTEITAMRDGGKMLAIVLDLLKSKLTPGISTKELADIAKTELRGLGGQPAFLGYYGFPDVLCVSVNDEVVHGIPRAQKIIQDGDVVGLDFGVTLKGLITDGAITVIAGENRQTAEQKLVKVTEQALYAGIDQAKSDIHIGNISAAIQSILEKNQLGIIRDLVGHGVGHELHEDPNIPNFGNKGSGPRLKQGMTIAIEPMATLGSYEVFLASDQWTVRTKDGSRAAHFEHTILITDSGAEILTQL